MPERLLHTAHAAYGTHIGVRMATASLRQAAAGSGGGHLGVRNLAVFEGRRRHGRLPERRRTQRRGGGFRHPRLENMLCMMAGQSIMVAGAEMPSHPLIKAG